MATSKIKETKYHKTDSKGSSCLVILEDNTDGFFNYKGEFTFKVGDQVEYTAAKTEKKSKPGEFYNVLTLTKVENTNTQPSTPQKETPSSSIPASTRPWTPSKNFVDMKFEARLHVIELVTRLIVAGKIEPSEAGEYYNQWVSMVDDTIDELSQR